MEVLKSGGVSNSEFLILRVKIDSKGKLKSNFLLRTINVKSSRVFFLKMFQSCLFFIPFSRGRSTQSGISLAD